VLHVKNLQMKRISLSILLALTVNLGFAQVYFSVSPQAADIYEVSSLTGTILSTSTITSTSGNISGFGGMAINPTNDDLFAVAKISGVRTLGVLDLSDNSFSVFSDLNDKYAGITFDDSGECYGITGDGADVPSSLYQINIATGDATLLLDLSATGADGEAIAYNSFDEKIYRYGGGSVWQTIDVFDLTIEEFTTSVEPANYGQALYYNADNNSFVLAAGDMIHKVTSLGVVTSSLNAEIGDDDGYKGIFLDTDIISVKENIDPKYSVYPNPSNDGTVNISSTSNLYSVSVYSIDGREVLLTKNIESLSTKIELTSGSYILKIETVTGQVSIEKLSIN
jgi:hypothetical protein